MVYNLEWSKEAACLDIDTSLFFELYELDKDTAHYVDTNYCMECPVQRTCLAMGVGRGEYGVWGGIYLEDGKISSEFNAHKTNDDWGQVWLRLTTNTTHMK